MDLDQAIKIISLIVAVIILGVILRFLDYKKKNKNIEVLLKGHKIHLKKKNISALKENYNKLREVYKKITPEEKKNYYTKTKKLHEEINKL